MSNESNQTRRVPLILRGFGIFLILAALFTALWWFCLHHYGNAAEWSGTDPADVRTDLVFEDKTFHLAAAVGSYGVSSGKFNKGERLGEVKPAGWDAFKTSYLVYAVEHAKEVDEAHLIVVYPDGKSYVYYLDGEENPYKGEWPTYDEDEGEWDEDEDY